MMAIHFSKDAPRNTEEKLGDWLSEISQATSVKGVAGGAALSLSEGYAVEYLSLESILKGSVAPPADAGGWRHLVFSGSHPVAEVELDPKTEPVAVHTGDGQEGLVAALDVAGRLDKDYLASVLVAPALHFIALHLHGEGSDDLFLPFPPNATALENYKTATAKEVLSVLQPLARDIAERPIDEDRPDGG